MYEAAAGQQHLQDAAQAKNTLQYDINICVYIYICMYYDIYI